MLEGTLAWVAEATGGELQGADLRFAGLGTDTRNLNAGRSVRGAARRAL